MLASINIEKDFEEIKKRKKKRIVSMSLNAENLDILKEDLKEHGVTLSGLFDIILSDMVTNIKAGKTKKTEDAEKNGEQKD